MHCRKRSLTTSNAELKDTQIPRNSYRRGRPNTVDLLAKIGCLVKRKIQFRRNTKGGSITVPLTSCLTGLDQPILQIKTKIVSCHTADSKRVKQEVNSTVKLPL